MSLSARCLGAPLALLSALALAAALAGCSQDIETPANRYAVVIGVQDYPPSNDNVPNNDPSDPDLEYSDDDANDLADLLAQKSWTVVSRLISATSDHVNEATYANIRDTIAGLSTLIGSDINATVLIYYSGHGEESTGKLVPYDALSDNNKRIAPATLANWLDALPCKNKMLILDSCYSGNFVVAGDSIDASPQDSNTSSGTTEDGLLETAVGNLGELIAASLEESGSPDVLAISAAGSAEFSWDGSAVMSNGAFTYYLLAAADHGDSNSDGYVTATEAFAYAKSCIKAYWNSVNADYGAAFLPHLSGGTGDLVLYVNK